MKSASISVAAFVLVACSGSTSSPVPITTEQAPTTPTPAPTATSGADAAASPPAEPDAGPAKKPGACASEPTQQGCSSCCAKLYENGAMTYLGAVIDCMCTDANCQKACDATLCSIDTPKGPDAACNSCLTAKNSACAGSVSSACTADGDCVLFTQCLGDSSCTGKP